VRHYRRHDEGLRIPGFALHHLAVRRLRRQGERREGVHDQVDPEHLDHRQGKLYPDHRAEQHDQQRRHVHRKLEEQEALDVLVERPPPQNRVDDARERVVEQHDVAGLLRHGGSPLPHGEPDVRVVQRRGVVRPVARHRDDFSLLLERLHQLQFVRGARPREHLQFVEQPQPCLRSVDHRLELVPRQQRELRLRPVADQPYLTADLARRLPVVAGDDLHADTRPRAGADGVGHVVAHRVGDSCESEPCQPLHKALGRDLSGLGKLAAHGEAEGAHPPGLEGAYGGQNLLLHPVRQRLFSRLGEDRGARFEQYFGRTLRVKHHAAVASFAEGRHVLPLGGECELIQHVE